jgi:hypothetical protein
MAADYNVLDGGLLPFGMVVLMLSPRIAGKVRGVIHSVRITSSSPPRFRICRSEFLDSPPCGILHGNIPEVAMRTSYCCLAAWVLLLGLGAAVLEAAEPSKPKQPMEVRVLVVKYFPVKGDRIDQTVTGDWGEPLAETRKKTTLQTEQAIHALQEGSRYHGYKDKNAKPCLVYKVLETIEYLEPLPTVAKSGPDAPMTDYNKIMQRVGIKKWVEEKGVKEVWLWGYHGGVVGLWESNMAGPFGDISNSNRDPKDLPVLKTTYTVYHYNYQRGTSEAVEDHMHQIEAVLNFVDGRDRTPPEQWPSLLFWGKFVGSDQSHKIVRPGCGWAHYPPNAEQDYDWGNKRFVETDIEDWKPDGTGKKQRMNCDRWGGDSLKWFVYWMQSIPGADNGLTYKGKPLNNWWVFIGDFDTAMKRKMTLMGE